MSDDDEGRDVFSAEEEEEPTSPRRVTRSSARAQTPGKTRTSTSTKSKGKGKEFLEPPQQPQQADARTSSSRRSTRASSRTSSSQQQPKSPSPAPPARKTRSGSKKHTRAEQEQEQEEGEDAEMDAEPEEEEEEQRPAKRTTAARAKSPSPAEASSSAEQPAAAAAALKITFPAPSSFPTTVPSTSTGRSSLRPGKSHTSRQHTTSSRVFSAKEEDLPPIDDAALAKIQMPAFKVPAGFSFGPPAPTAGTTGINASATSTNAAADSTTTEITPAAPTTSLLSRLGAAPPSTSSAETTKTAFSFGAPSAAATKPAPTSFSFGAPPAATNAATDKETTAATSKPAPPNFFASKPTAPAFSGADAGSSKPNFFGAIIAADADKSKDAGTDTNKSTPSFTFGAPPAAKSSTDSVIKPTEVIPPTPAAVEAAPKPAPVTAATSGGNPFAAFGKPVAELVKEAEGSKDAASTKPASPFSFGAPPTTETTTTNASKKDEAPKKDEVGSLGRTGKLNRIGPDPRYPGFFLSLAACQVAVRVRSPQVGCSPGYCFAVLLWRSRRLESLGRQRQACRTVLLWRSSSSSCEARDDDADLHFWYDSGDSTSRGEEGLGGIQGGDFRRNAEPAVGAGVGYGRSGRQRHGRRGRACCRSRTGTVLLVRRSVLGR